VRHIRVLAGEIGERHLGRPAALAQAADYIEEQFAGLKYAPLSQKFAVLSTDVRNIEATRESRGNDIVVIGAHYDSVSGSPGANDNASGVAALLELAHLLALETSGRTYRFVAFVNEEPPYFMSEFMGSVVYARHCRARGDKIAGMFSLETIGYYSEERRSQHYPGPPLFRLLYPDTGNFIGFVANIASRRLLRDAGRAFRSTTRFPSEGAAAPEDIPGVGWSDHWSFWQEGYPAVMITDMAPYRYPHYHQPTDTPDKLSYDALARVVVGLSRMFRSLGGT
jgi:Zn-dependent M28 family amino/carboxypeptidase